jgi:hypothetical protein
MELAEGRELTSKTMASHYQALKHVRRYFAGRKVGRIRPSDCEQFRGVPALPTRPNLAS